MTALLLLALFLGACFVVDFLIVLWLARKLRMTLASIFFNRRGR